MTKYLQKTEFHVFIILVAFSLVCGSMNAGFWSALNIFSVLKSSSTVGIMALGMLMVIVAGGIDISIPAVAVFAVYSTAKYLVSINYSGGILLPFAMATVIGGLLGCVNAFFISKYRLAPLIVTLGMASACTGFLRTFIGSSVIANLPQSMFDFSRATILSVTQADGSVARLSVAVVVLAVVTALVWFLMNYTTPGRGLYALGNDPVAAERISFNNKRIQFMAYGLSGALAGITGVVHVSLIRQANIRDLEGVEMEVIAAVVLGGTAITGGRGTVVGTLLGVLLLTVIKSSLILMDIPSSWQKVVIGGVPILATVTTSLRKKSF
ncbi:MAG: ABC transporter permease [Planctomycetaceae bacterium]|nr:ABC transporter permease [Planctomycetaceae bacterium]